VTNRHALTPGHGWYSNVIGVGLDLPAARISTSSITGDGPGDRSPADPHARTLASGPSWP